MRPKMIWRSEEVFGHASTGHEIKNSAVDGSVATRGLAVKRLICAVLAIVLILAGTVPADAWGARGFHGSTVVASSRTVVVAPRAVVVARPHVGSTVIVSSRAVVVA